MAGIGIELNILSDKALRAIKKATGAIEANINSAFVKGTAAAKRFSSAVSDATKEYERLNQENEDFLNFAEGAAIKAGIAFAGFGAAIGGAIAQAAKFEDIGVQFEVLTGNVEVANGALKELQDFSAGTPFQFASIANAGKQLLGFGFEVDELNTKLTEIGNVAAASGKSIDEISLIFGQVAAAGKLTGERLLQFQERAIPIGPAIAKTLGVAETAVKDLVTKGVVDFATFEKAFASLSEEGGFAFEGLIKLSKTFNGALSTLGDVFALLGDKIGQFFLPTAKQVIIVLTNILNVIRESEVLSAFVAGFLALGAAISGTVLAIATASIAFVKLKIAIVAVNAALIPLGVTLGTLTTIVGAVVAGFALLGSALFGIFKIFQLIEEETKIISTIFGVISEVLATALTPILGDTTDAFKGLGDVLVALAGRAIGKVIQGFIKLTDVVAGFVQSNPFGIFDDAQVNRILVARDRLNLLSQSLDGANDNFFKFSDTVAKTTNSAADQVDKNKKKIDEAFSKFNTKGIQDLEKKLQNVGVSQLDQLKRTRDERLKLIEGGLKGEGETLKKAKALEEKILEDFNSKAVALNKKRNTSVIKDNTRFIQEFQRQFDQVEASIDKVFSGANLRDSLRNIFGSETEQTRAIENLQKQLDDNLTISPELRAIKQQEIDGLRRQLSQASTAAIGIGFANAFAGGAQGAQAVVLDFATLGLDAIAPGLGQALNPLINLFAQGPDAIREQVKAFADAIPVIVENVLTGLPVFIEALAEQAPIIIERLAEKSDEIIIALVKATPRVAIALAKALAFQVPFELAKTLPQALINIFANVGPQLVKFILEPFNIIRNFFSNLPNIFAQAGRVLFDSVISAGSRFISEIISGAGSFVEELIKSIPIVGDFLGGGSGGGIIGGVTGAVGGIVGGIGDAFGFATGGIVPDGFPNDTFPARLTSREFVVRDDLTPKLESFLDSQNNQSGPDETAKISLLTEIADLLRGGQQVNASVELNESTFANILLELSRTNQRIA